MQFVVLHHTGYGEPHFDVMLELEPGGPLTTWRSPVWPLEHQTALTPLAEHRREYLTYEGEVSNGRGEVKRVASGDYELLLRGARALVIRLPGNPPEEWEIVAQPAVGAIALRAGENVESP